MLRFSKYGVCVILLDLAPDSLADAATVHRRRDEEKIKHPLTFSFVKDEDDAARNHAVCNNAIRMRMRFTNTFQDCRARDDFTRLLEMAVAESEFLHRTVSERFLVVPHELFAITVLKRQQPYHFRVPFVLVPFAFYG